MPATHTIRTTPFGGPAVHHAAARVAAVVRAVRAWRRARATETALSRLSDRELADIGLHRGAIAAFAEALARRS